MTNENIKLFTDTRIVDKSGSIGNFEVKIKRSPIIKDNGFEIFGKEETFTLKVGAILLTTGFDHYEPKVGEYGYKNINNVITLPKFKKLVESNNGVLKYNNKTIKNIAYVYCVGSRQTGDGNKYCSRFCCTAAIDTAILVSKKFKGINNFHFNRGIRTYGKQEILYHKSCENGDTYLQFDEEYPLIVEQKKGSTIVKVNDILTEGREMELEADLVVLITGMVPNEYSDLLDVLKVPVGRDSFFNEVHLKLRPVETVLEGIYIAGCCQGPKDVTESVKSSISAASKIGGLLWNGKIELEPVHIEIDKNSCEWCDRCADACSYDAIRKIKSNGKYIATVVVANCKGCGMCMPVCESNSISLLGYSDELMESMIDALVD
jgi:heterodisulfide reductase subunit A